MRSAPGFLPGPLRQALHGLEAQPVHLGHPVPLDRPVVRGRAVALVGGEAVLRVLPVHPHHESVPGDLGDDRGRRDGKVLAIPADDGLARVALRELRRNLVAVHEDPAHLAPDAAHGPRHRLQRGAQDVDPVDAPRARHGHRPAHARAPHERRVGALALRRAQPLRVQHAPRGAPR
eukprot:CAMPEP_0204594992 /NCGR_PEP_ID=MMETSP0661-20131031/52407_1 /ASSEMBLY_ACC=CAM_ASM_000606 /TAXON_ID=109239 /ORGANISM="Alexandrium margalefi, Strain AMGDE01CS-322" /LENGTH=175 /DNA_ID=CAMNT_0051605461 /DNA_START=29 /DNA_END=552 /DNA_ORIENTATION=+